MYGFIDSYTQSFIALVTLLASSPLKEDKAFLVAFAISL
jgi:hypothetical protein